MISGKCYAIPRWVSPVGYIPLLISSSFSAFLRTDWRTRLSDLWRMSSRELLPMFSLSSGRRCPPLKQTPHKVKQRSSSGSWIDGIVGQGFLQLQLDREQQGRRMEQANLSITAVFPDTEKQIWHCCRDWNLLGIFLISVTNLSGFYPPKNLNSSLLELGSCLFFLQNK